MIHKYSLNGYHIVLDVNSGAVHVMEELPFRMLDYLEDSVPDTMPQKLLDELSSPPRKA